METMQPILIGGRAEWDQINMPKAEFQERVDRIRKEMKKEGIDVLLVYGVFHKYGDLGYISNYVPIVPKSGALVAIPQKGEAVSFMGGGPREVFATKRITWVEDVRPSMHLPTDCVKYLEEKNFMTSTIGFVGLRQLMPYSQWQGLREKTNQCKVVDADYIITDMRIVKSQRECDQIRRSARILLHVFDSIPDTLFRNMNEEILEAIVDREARLAGAEDFRMLVAKPRGKKWALRPAEDVQISPGDSVIIYLAVSFERYWSEGIRTFVAELSSLTKPASENAEALYERISGMIKPGKTASQFYKETIAELQRGKIEYIPDYGLGQGIGLDLQESPVITEEDATLLKEGMCLTLRLAIKDADLGAIMMGDTIHLSKDGPEVLTK